MSIKVHEPDKKSGRGGTDILSALLKSGVELKSRKGNTETKDAGKVGQKRDRVTAGDKKEEERMQQKTDMDALKKQGEALDSEAAKKAEADGKKEEGAAKPKKKNIIQVFRPQNSKTGMVKPGSRPRPQGQGRPQRAPGQPGARPAGRPQGQAGAVRTPEQAASARAGAAKTPEQTAAVKPGTARAVEPQTPVKQEEGKTAAQTAVRTEPAKAPVQAENRRPSAAKTETVQVSKTEADKNEVQASSAKPEAVQAEKTAQPETKAAAGRTAAQAESVTAEKTVKTAEKTGVQVQTAKTEPVQGEMKMQENRQPEAKAAAPAADRTQSSVKNQGQQNTARVQGSRGQNSGRVQDGRNQNSGARSQNSRSQDGSQGNRSQGGRSQDGNQGGRRYQDGSQNRSQGGRSQDGTQNRSQGGRYQDGTQNRGQSGRYQDGNQNRSQGSRSQDNGQGTRSQSGKYQDGTQNRSQGGRYQDGNQNRSQGGRYQDNGMSRGTGRSQDGGQNRNQGGRYQDGNQNRNQGGRTQNGRSMGIPKPPVESKPLEKESRKRTERGDRNRDSKGEKLDRLEQNGRPGKKGGQQRTAKVAKPAPKPVEKQEEVIKNITIPEKLTIKELGEAMKVQPSAIVKKLFLQGVMVTVNEEIEFEKAEEIALEFNCICEKEEKVNVLEELLKEEEEDEATLIPRSPVVCVMGHVDHGKTSLLDAIRNTHVIDKEAGGITQHIGAYVVSIDGQKITFLDTPGHEAFTAMRMRGANATDIAILVVAADDGVMPQTIEAINHAKAAGIEIIVAINKIDKPSANVERVKQELSEYELIPEDWGGSTVFVPVSAHTHEGIDTLLEMILLTAEVSELRANPKRKARGLVIEAQLDKGKGPVATVLVQKGTLHVGDPVAAGSCYGKVRAMMDDKGRRVKEAGPSTPVEILGFSDVPNAGEIFMAMDNEKEARSFAETFISEGRERMLEETKARMSLDDLFSQIQAGNLKELNIIVKADVQGSVEAVKQSLLKLSNEEVIIKIIHGGVGAINESDVILASASNAIIIGFNVRPDAMAKTTAERENVDVRLYRVIYDAIADVEAAMKGMLDPIYEEKVIGHAEVRQTFRASGVGTIAGSYVTDGIFQRNCKIRITREGSQIYEGALASLKRFKDDVKEVKAGYECGLVFEKFNDVREEDKVEAYIMVEVPR